MKSGPAQLFVKGKLDLAQSHNQIKKKLIEEWQLSPKQVDEWLSGDTVFFKQNVNELELKLFQKAFQEMGLTCEILYPDSKEEKPISTPQIGEIQLAKTTHSLLGLATTLFFIAFILDNTLSKMSIYGFEYLDLGYFPYLISFVTLCLGLSKLSELKGYPKWLGALGMSGLFGLGILLILPDKNHDRKISLISQQSLFSVFCIAVGFYSATQFMASSEEVGSYLSRQVELPKGRNEYPSAIAQNELSIYQSEWDELNSYVDEGLALLKQGGFRSRDIANIAGVMTSSAEQFFIWINYQRYINEKNKNDLSKVLSLDLEKQWKTNYWTKLDHFIAEPGLPEQSVKSLEIRLRTRDLDNDHYLALMDLSMFLKNLFEASYEQNMEIKRRFSRETLMERQKEKMAQKINGFNSNTNNYKNNKERKRETLESYIPIQLDWNKSKTGTPKKAQVVYEDGVFTVRFIFGVLKEYDALIFFPRSTKQGGIEFLQIAPGFPNYLVGNNQFGLFRRQKEASFFKSLKH